MMNRTVRLHQPPSCVGKVARVYLRYHTLRAVQTSRRGSTPLCPNLLQPVIISTPTPPSATSPLEIDRIRRRR